jgi:hypothetical protein
MALEWIAAAIAKVNDTHGSIARPSEAGDWEEAAVSMSEM